MKIPYNNPYFNRATLSRKGVEVSQDSRLLLLSPEGAILFRRVSGRLKLALFPLECFPGRHEELVFLGICEGRDLWSLPCTEDGQKEPLWGENADKFLHLRDAFPEIDGHTRALLAYALGMHKWHDRTKYCGSCGYKTRAVEYGHVRLCTNAGCRQLQYPHIAPAVIVLIEHYSSDGTPYCLLEKRHSPSGISCSTLAGFVEVGESLEDAVIREMKEEVDMEVTNIRYVNSQPWVFSSSLMVGFYAEAKQLEFRVDGAEVTEAAWFSPQQIRSQVEAGQIMLSKQDSIARFLIENWVALNNR